MDEDTPLFVPGLEPPGDDQQGYWFCFRGRELLLCAGALEPVGDLEDLGVTALRIQFLGTLGGVPCWSADLGPETRPPGDAEFRDLRALFGRLDETLHALAGRAVQLVEWDRNHQFCGACGKPTVLAEQERSRTCPDCKLPHYPRLAPSMIVAVERDREILLARSPHFPPGIYSVLAGFVEPGESVEDTVRREVFEETGIEICDLRYFGSQPWPFPNSLMLGFQARYQGGEIRVDGVEIEDAGWFPHDDLPRTFPGNVSISQWLLHDFLARHRGL